MTGRLARAPAVVVGCSLASRPVVAHGLTTAGTGLDFPLVVGAAVGASVLGGGCVLAVATAGRGRRSVGTLAPFLLLALGGTALALAVARTLPVAVIVAIVAGGSVSVYRGASFTGCGTCADATLGAVTLHRGLEGAVLATVYLADAALGLAGAAVLAVHGTAETAAVASLYSGDRRRAAGAVVLVQLGFVAGVVVGWRVLGELSPVLETGVLALVGGVLVAVGGNEVYHRLVVPSAAAG